MSFIDEFRHYSQTRQVLLIVAAFVVVCTISVAGYFTFLRTPYEALFSSLRTSDAATIVADLVKKKVPYRLKDGGSTILVPAGVADSTRLDVMSEDLPIKGQVGFELFNKSDMGLTEFAQKINYQRALQGELARTIMTLDSVDTARVHLSLPDPSVFREDKRPPKASATLIPRPGRLVPGAAVAGIRRLIAAAVPDLDPVDVVILDQHGDVLAGDPAPNNSFETASAVTPDVAPPPPSYARVDAEAPSATSANHRNSFVSASTFWTSIALALLIPLVFLAGFIARRQSASHRLNDQERTAYADRFRTLLDEGGAGAGPLG
jgi:flagellar basal-body M-ring protein/flagellar hook-basal body protein fliF